MATPDMESGGTGRRVADNLRRLREARGLSLRALAEEVRRVGGSLSADAINKIENGRTLPPGAVPPKQIRRVDVEDLVALALALEVTPLTLLLPPDASDKPVDLTADYTVATSTAWEWAMGRRPAMDWQPGEGVNLAGPGVSPFIPLDAQEREEEFGRRRTEYMRLALPPGLRRAVDDPRVRLAEEIEILVENLVAGPGGRDERALWLEHAQTRIRHLQDNLREYAQMLERDGGRELERMGLSTRSEVKPDESK